MMAMVMHQKLNYWKNNKMVNAKILSCGSYLPKKILTDHLPELSRLPKFGLETYMNKLILLLSALLILAAGCQKVELKREVPSSPKESYEELPK